MGGPFKRPAVEERERRERELRRREPDIAELEHQADLQDEARFDAEVAARGASRRPWLARWWPW